MFIHKIVPLTHLPSLSSEQVFDYFSKENLARGSIVEIEFAKKQKLGFVLESIPAEGLKGYLKRLSFSLKPVSSVLYRGNFFTEAQIQLANFLANYFATPLSLSYKKFFLYPKKFYSALPVHCPLPSADKSGPHQEYFGRSLDSASLRRIQNAISGNAQVLVLCPSISDLNAYRERLKNFQPMVAGEKKTVPGLIDIRNGKARIVASNKSGVFLPYRSLDLIVFLEEDSEHYKFWGQKPYFHAKTACRELARIFGADLLLISRTPSVETYHKITLEEIHALPSS